MSQTSSNGWLSIREASRFLGVHIGTVREWADAGLLPSYRTPGGHRRFSAVDLDSFIKRQKSGRLQSQSSADHALGVIRQVLQSHPLTYSSWFQNLSITPDPQHRVQQREFGQQLLQTVVSYAESPERRDLLLDEGRLVARAYGKALAGSGLSAGNAARATIYFRGLILKTVLEAKIGARVGDEEDARLFQRVSTFLDEILLAILDAYS